MARSFGVSEQFIDADLSKFIAVGRINATIDKVDGVITTNKLASQNKTAMYEQIIKQGDILLSGEPDLVRNFYGKLMMLDIQKLHRVVG